jgi:hypothetical protein
MHCAGAELCITGSRLSVAHREGEVGRFHKANDDTGKWMKWNTSPHKYSDSKKDQFPKLMMTQSTNFAQTFP